jgi:hypothetical protein
MCRHNIRRSKAQLPPMRRIATLYDAFGKTSTMQKDWGYALCEGVELSATNTFELQNTVGIENNHRNEDRKIGRGQGNV